MAAPTRTARSAPTGKPAKEGFPMAVTFACAPSVTIWEQDVQPPGVQVGGKLPLTTQFNKKFKTFGAPALKEITDGQVNYLYNSHSYADIINNVVGVETTINYWYPDGRVTCVYGYLESFQKSSTGESKVPTATGRIVHTCVDPSDGSEEGPVTYDATGTATTV